MRPDRSNPEWHKKRLALHCQTEKRADPCICSAGISMCVDSLMLPIRLSIHLFPPFSTLCLPVYCSFQRCTPVVYKACRGDFNPLTARNWAEDNLLSLRSPRHQRFDSQLYLDHMLLMKPMSLPQSKIYPPRTIFIEITLDTIRRAV